MTNNNIVVQLPLFDTSRLGSNMPGKQADLHTRWLYPETLSALITACAPAMRVLDLLGPLHWDNLPERNLQRDWGKPTISNASLIIAELVKLNEGLSSFGVLYRYLQEHTAFISLCGFPLCSVPATGLSFNTRSSLPTERHFTRMLQLLPRDTLQFLLNDSIQLIGAELAVRGITWGDCISLDTKHIIAWVQENNPKAYVANRYDKHKHPCGDPDCRLGCKRKHNRPVEVSTPAHNSVTASSSKVGEYYWGYGSGIVVTKVPVYGEFVLAELTQPFDHGDLTYFFPLMHDTEQRLGHQPHFGTFDAAFDAWYVYAYFSAENGNSDGFAAVPFSEKGGYKANGRHFAPDGLPLCAASLPMPLKCAFTDHASCLIAHQRGLYVCPISFDSSHQGVCPINHKNWAKGGCTAMMPTSIGARLRYQIDRDSDVYKDLYRQRTACERINSQAVALGIERPHLRNGAAITNQNTLIYLLINLRFLQRLRQGQVALD